MILGEGRMAQPIYKLWQGRFTEAWHQLPQQEQLQLLGTVQEAMKTVGGKPLAICEAAWSNEQWPYFGRGIPRSRGRSTPSANPHGTELGALYGQSQHVGHRTRFPGVDQASGTRASFGGRFIRLPPVGANLRLPCRHVEIDWGAGTLTPTARIDRSGWSDLDRYRRRAHPLADPVPGATSTRRPESSRRTSTPTTGGGPCGTGPSSRPGVSTSERSAVWWGSVFWSG